MSRTTRMVIVGVAVVIVGFIVVTLITLVQKKAKINAAYQKLTLPTEFAFDRQEYIHAGIDTVPSWSYTYTVNMPAAQVASALIASLASAGCVNGAHGATHFICSDAKLQLDTDASAVGTAGLTKPPFHVRITASSL